MGPGVDEPLTVTSMLDCGAHVALIDAALVFRLGLHLFHLHKPLPISVALNNTMCSDSHLHEYVKIAPFAPDSSYVSHTIKAVVTPSLCVPLLLGLPFLSINNIVADFIARTAIDKRCDYDLLNLPRKIKCKKLIELSVSVMEVKNNKRNMLQELVLVCNEHLKNGKGVPKSLSR
jgi:hypothetical protein